MSSKFFYLYLIGGTIALVLMLYKMFAAYPPVNFNAVSSYILPVALLYYLAYKVYHEKKDEEMM